MSNYVKKTPDVSVEGLNDDHRPSATSKSESLSSSAISKDELPCPETAHRHGVPTYNDANQIEKAEATAPCSDPSPPSNGNDNPSSREDAKDKCGWRRSCCTMIAETLSLGILSLPAAAAAMGLIPTIVLLISFGFITTGTGYCYYLYKEKYPHIRSIPQALDNIFGAPGRWITDIIITVYLILLMAGHLILFSSFVQAFSKPEDVPCRIAVMGIAYFINCLFTFYRKFARLGYVCVACCFSILIATFVCLGYLAADKDKNLSLPGNYSAFAVTPLGLHYGDGKVTTIFGACAAFSNILLSYSGSICYFNIIDEMKEPRDFWKCLLVTNAATITMYTIAGIGMYALAGQLVGSPALDSAGSQGAKIAYCFGLPTILLAAVILANVNCKRTEDLIYAWRGLDAEEAHRSQRKAFSAVNVLWYAIVISWWTVSFIVGNSLPFFGPLLAVIGAISGNWICLGWPGMFMLHLWRPEVIQDDGTERKFTRQEIKEAGGWWKCYTTPNRWRKLLVPAMILLIVINIAASALGLYGSVMQFAVLGKGRKPFSCEYDWK